MGELILAEAAAKERRARIRRKIFITCAVIVAAAAFKYIVT